MAKSRTRVPSTMGLEVSELNNILLDLFHLEAEVLCDHWGIDDRCHHNNNKRHKCFPDVCPTKERT